MINLFRKIYLSYDTDLRSGKNQERIIVTDRKFPYPISNDPVLRKGLGILEHYSSVNEFLNEQGSIANVVAKLFTTDQRICFITTHEFATLIHMSVFKSLAVNPTIEAAYLLYRATYMHQKAISLRNLTDYDNDMAFKGEFPVMFSDLEFADIYAKAEECPALAGIAYQDIPIELLMGSYMAGNIHNPDQRFAFLQKYRNIVLENAIFRIRILRNEIMANSVPVSAYLGREVDEIDATTALIAHPTTAWLADEIFGLYNTEDASKKYSLAQLLDIFDSIEKLMQVNIEEKRVLQYLARGEVRELLDVDMEDERGNYLGTEHFVSKINGVFINKCYQEFRKFNHEFFKPFLLKD